MNEISFHDDIPCWVCLIQRRTGFEIDFVLNPQKMFIKQEEDDTARLVYSRRFDNILDGIGHKLLLENISEQSLRRLIKNNGEENEKTNK